MNFDLNYYHFLLEDLPRLLLLRRFRGLRAVYTRRRKLPSYIIDTLDLLEIEVKLLSRPTKFSELYFVAPLGELFRPSPLAIDLVRSELLPFRNADSQRTRKIYVSRKFASRSMANEEGIEEWLTTKGFEVVHPERLSVQNQIQLFAESQLVIGPHGAGLANLVFMPIGTTVIELMETTYTNPLYQLMAGNAVQYDCLLVDDQIGSLPRLFDRLEAKIGKSDHLPD